MDKDPRDDLSSPFEPDNPEDLKALIERRFLQWWEELDPPESFNGIPLDRPTAFATWMAMQDEINELVEALYDSCQATIGIYKQTAYEETAYIINKLTGKKSIEFDLQEYIKWLSYHCENARREYDQGTVRIIFDTPTETPRPLI